MEKNIMQAIMVELKHLKRKIKETGERVDRDIAKTYYTSTGEKYCDANGRSIRKHLGKGKGRKGSKDQCRYYKKIIKTILQRSITCTNHNMQKVLYTPVEGKDTKNLLVNCCGSSSRNS